VTTHSHSIDPKPGNGNEKHSAASAKKAATSISEDIQDDLQALRQDVMRLTQQLAKVAAATGNEAWGRAKDDLDDVLNGAQAKGRQAADAVGEVRDKFVGAIDESLEQRPYTTLALALAMGLVVGAMWKR
jgi:ElaB/YqjD/DUF883 family membrane-anchored ribosome-binding protein